jgi:tetratricopeptide (TPR) repeat protein
MTTRSKWQLVLLCVLCWQLVGCDQARTQFQKWFPAPDQGDIELYQQTKRGQLLFQQKKHQQALKLFLALQSKHPQSIPLMYNLGAVHLELGTKVSGKRRTKHFAQAKGYLSRVLTKGSAKLRQRAHYNLGMLFTKKRQYNKALFHFEQSVYLAKKVLKRADKDAVANRNLLATLLRQRARKRQQLNRSRVFRYDT